MGIKSSFITEYCTQLKMDLNQKNLLSLEFEKVTHHPISSSQSQNQQLYQHYQSKKLYKLEKFTCLGKDSQILSKALQSLEMIKNDHISNVLFSSINTSFPNIISKASEIKIFTEYSSSNLLNLIDKKSIEKKQIQALTVPSSKIIPFTNTEISNFIHAISGIAGEISKMCLPVEYINPKDFLLVQNEAGKIKYDVQFEQIMNQNHSLHQKSYFSPQVWDPTSTSILNFVDLIENRWQQKYEKNVVFALGMITLHFLLLQPCDDCYNYKSKEFCRSQLENKLYEVSSLLQNRFCDRQQRKQKFRDSQDIFNSSVYIQRLVTQNKSQEQEEPFESILYETIVQMLTEDTTKRINVNELKIRSRKLMQKVRQEVTIQEQKNTSVSNIRMIRERPPKIRSIDKSSEKSFQQMNVKKTISNQQNNTTASILEQSKSRSIIRQLKSKRASDKEKSFIDEEENQFLRNKENLLDNSLQTSGIKVLKGSIRKLSGYKRVKISEHSFMEGFFQNNKAHGLGRITRKNGQIIECIFDNDQIIEEIPYQQR